MTFNFGSVNSIRTIFLNQLLVFKVCVCLRNLSCSYHWRVFILHGCIALAACRECVLCHHFVSPPGGHPPHVSHFPLLPTFLLFCIAHRQVDCCVCANHRQQWEELCLPKAEESNPIPVVAACTHSFLLFPPPLSSSVSHQQFKWMIQQLPHAFSTPRCSASAERPPACRACVRITIHSAHWNPLHQQFLDLFTPRINAVSTVAIRICHTFNSACNSSL